MAKDESRRVRPQVLADDLDSYARLQDMSGYAPANAAFTREAITVIYNTMIAKQHGEAQAEAAFDSARDDSVAAEWAMHNAMLGATDQVAAQYGTNSNEYQAMGRKKKSEYSRPTREAKPPSTGGSGG
jgi:hypothetical protein